MQLKCPLMNIGIAVSMAVCGMCLYAKTSSANGTVAKVVEKSDAVAQFRYAEMLRDGRGVAKNVREAVTWTRKAADGDLAAAQCLMGLFYMNGIGVDRDEDKAVEWLNKAAEQGNARAQVWIWGRYLNGTGVEKEEFEAVKWFRKAAEQGHKDAETALQKLQESQS